MEFVMKKYLLITLTLLLSATHCFAAEWKLDESGGYYDASSVIKSGNTVRVWIKFVEEAGKDGVPASVPKRTNTNLYSIDCKERTFILQAANSTYQDGITRNSLGEYPNAGISSPIYPDSGIDSLSKLLCKSFFDKFKWYFR